MAALYLGNVAISYDWNCGVFRFLLYHRNFIATINMLNSRVDLRRICAARKSCLYRRFDAKRTPVYVALYSRIMARQIRFRPSFMVISSLILIG